MSHSMQKSNKPLWSAKQRSRLSTRVALYPRVQQHDAGLAIGALARCRSLCLRVQSNALREPQQLTSVSANTILHAVD